MRTCAIIHPLHLELETAQLMGSGMRSDLLPSPSNHDWHTAS